MALPERVLNNTADPWNSFRGKLLAATISSAEESLASVFVQHMTALPQQVHKRGISDLNDFRI